MLQQLESFVEGADVVITLWTLCAIAASLFGYLAHRAHWLDRPVAMIRGRFSGLSDVRRRWLAVRDDLNGALSGEARLWALIETGPPPLREDKPAAGELTWLAEPAIEDRARAIKATLDVDVGHGLALDQGWSLGGSAPVRFVRTNYAMIKAARERDLRPPILSAGAIVFCPAERSVLLQFRSHRVETYPNCLHTLGGNYEPPTSVGTRDGFSLAATAMREVEEETGMRGLSPAGSLLLVSEEVTTGFVQYVYAGVSVRPARLKDLQGSGEGDVRFVQLEQLCEFFETGLLDGAPRKFVPSGAMLLLCWLGMGAPDQKRLLPMKGDALKAYRRMRPHLSNILGER